MARDNRAQNQKDVIRLGSNKWRNRLERQGKLDDWDKAFKKDAKAAMQALRGEFKNNPYAFAGALAGGYQPDTGSYVAPPTTITPPPPAQTHVVTKTDTLTTIADKYQLAGERNILDANDITSLKPGMVLNIPREPGERAGLPSNGPLGQAAGAATPFKEAPVNANQLGAGYLASERLAPNLLSGRPIIETPYSGGATTSKINPLLGIQAASYAGDVNAPFVPKRGTYTQTGTRGMGLGAAAGQYYNQINTPFKPTLQYSEPIGPPAPPVNPYANYISDRNKYFKGAVKDMMTKMENGVATPREVNRLIELGYWEPDTGTSGTGGTGNDYSLTIGSGRWQGRGGRKKWSNKQKQSRYQKQQQQQYQPNPFASDAGFGGLVSWRT